MYVVKKGLKIRSDTYKLQLPDFRSLPTFDNRHSRRLKRYHRDSLADSLFQRKSNISALFTPNRH